MTEKEIRQEAEERYLFPSVEYDDYNSVNAFVDGAKWAIDKLTKQMLDRYDFKSTPYKFTELSF